MTMERNERSMSTRTNVRGRVMKTRKRGIGRLRSPPGLRSRLPRSWSVFLPGRLFLTLVFVRLGLFSVEFSPFYGIEKGLVLQETRVFNEAQVRISGWFIDIGSTLGFRGGTMTSSGAASQLWRHHSARSPAYPSSFALPSAGGSSQVSAGHHQASLPAHTGGNLHEVRIIGRVLQRHQALHAQGFPPPSHGLPLHQGVHPVFGRGDHHHVVPHERYEQPARLVQSECNSGAVQDYRRADAAAD